MNRAIEKSGKFWQVRSICIDCESGRIALQARGWGSKDAAKTATINGSVLVNDCLSLADIPAEVREGVLAAVAVALATAGRTFKGATLIDLDAAEETATAATETSAAEATSATAAETNATQTNEVAQ